MFKEIRTQERITDEERRRRENENNFRQIKPSKDMTVKEAEQIMMNLLFNMREA